MTGAGGWAAAVISPGSLPRVAAGACSQGPGAQLLPRWPEARRDNRYTESAARCDVCTMETFSGSAARPSLPSQQTHRPKLYRVGQANVLHLSSLITLLIGILQHHRLQWEPFGVVNATLFFFF